MAIINLGYGHQSITFDYDPAQFEVLSSDANADHPLSDAEIGAAIDTPIESARLEDKIDADDRVLIVVSDATRATGSPQIINLLVRRLIQNGIQPGDIAIIFATGIHRAVRAEEKLELLTPFIAQRIRTIDHDAYDPAQLTQVGETASGAPVELNRALVRTACGSGRAQKAEFDKIILTGAVGFHYFAGFTGGRKAICPGLASARTIAATHMLAMDFERGGRRAGVGSGLLDGNAVNEECERITAMIDPAFIVNASVDERGRVTGIFAGHWRTAHRRACEAYARTHSQSIAGKRETVIVSCGGSPYDLNLIQAHKALDMAALACADGGTIILLAECGDGFGREDFLKWFESPDSRALEARLQKEYEVNGQTAWALLTKTERFKIHIVSKLSDDDVRRMRMTPAQSIEAALSSTTKQTTGYIMPRGAALLPD